MSLGCLSLPCIVHSLEDGTSHEGAGDKQLLPVAIHVVMEVLAFWTLADSRSHFIVLG